MVLSKLLRSPVVSKVDFSGEPCKTIAGRLDARYSLLSNNLANPDQDMMMFYLQNHAVSLVRKRVSPLESLGDYEWIVRDYLSHTAMRVERLWYYMLLIVSREARHVKKTSSFTDAFKNSADPAVYEYVKSIPSGSESAAERFRKKPPNVSIGRYLSDLSTLFHTCNWAGGYGGEAWGLIVDCALAYSKGEYSAEMFIDTAYTLCHNNGPIFNKGMLYDHYSNNFQKLLDVQRGGQMPQYFSETPVPFTAPNSVNRDWYLKAEKTLGDEFAGHVDWYLVDKWGVKSGSYESLKSNQTKKYGTPAWMVEEEKKKIEEIAKKDKPKAMLMKKKLEGKVFEVLSDSFVILERSEL